MSKLCILHCYLFKMISSRLPGNSRPWKWQCLMDNLTTSPVIAAQVSGLLDETHHAWMSRKLFQLCQARNYSTIPHRRLLVTGLRWFVVSQLTSFCPQTTCCLLSLYLLFVLQVLFALLCATIFVTRNIFIWILNIVPPRPGPHQATPTGPQKFLKSKAIPIQLTQSFLGFPKRRSKEICKKLQVGGIRMRS